MDKRIIRALIAAAIAISAMIGVAWWSLSDGEVRKAIVEGWNAPPPAAHKR